LVRKPEKTVLFIPPIKSAGECLSGVMQGAPTMPKMKTNRGAAKRFKATGSGKIRRSRAFASHILTKKSTKRKRNLRKNTLIADVDQRAVRRMLPYM
jgi:large subunit ribosomal protein L35